MRLTFDVRRDMKRFLAIGGVSLALVIGQAGAAFAAPPLDSDKDDLTNARENIKLRILVANELRFYREAIASALSALESLVEVIAVEPEELDGELERFAPHLVICSRVSAAVKERALAWVELYPDHGPLAFISIGGELSTVEGIELSDVLSIVDRTKTILAAMATEEGG